MPKFVPVTVTVVPVIALDRLNDVMLGANVFGMLTVESVVPPTVRFTTAVYGVHRPGTAYRMDEIPIPLRGFLPTDYPSDYDVLTMIGEQVASGERKGGSE